MKQRNLTFDYARFIAISLVILGHLIQYNDIKFDDNYLFKIIYSFHMPLFVFISAYLSFNSLFERVLVKDIKQKTVHLLLPFFIWGTIMYIVQDKNDFINLILHPDSAYWFLWVLFWIYVLCKIMIYLYRYKKLYALVLIPIIYMVPSEYLGFGLIKYLSIYFILGLLTYKYQDRIYNFLKYMDQSYYIFISSIIFFLLAYYYDRSNTIYYSYFNSSSLYMKLSIYGYKIFLAMLGIVLVFKLSRKIVPLFGSDNFILTIGQKYTLAIYVTHYYFLHLYANDNFYISFTINSIIMCIFLFILYFVLQSKYNYMNFILFGIKKG